MKNHSMKKAIAFAAAFVMLFLLAACTQQDAVQTSEPPAAPAPSHSEEAVQTPEATPEQQPTPEAEEAYTYTSQMYGFTVTMPLSWKEECEIVEENMLVSFYSIANAYTLEGVEYKSLLFSVTIPEDDMKNEDGSYSFPDYEVIGQINGADILVLHPSDVQYNLEDDDATQEYMRMMEELPAVIESITFG